MDRKEAIQWCKESLSGWPRSTAYAFPNGWRWVVHNEPYRDNEYYLVSTKGDRIRKGDIK